MPTLSEFVTIGCLAIMLGGLGPMFYRKLVKERSPNSESEDLTGRIRRRPIDRSVAFSIIPALVIGIGIFGFQAMSQVEARDWLGLALTTALIMFLSVIGFLLARDVEKTGQDRRVTTGEILDGGPNADGHGECEGNVVRAPSSLALVMLSLSAWIFGSGSVMILFSYARAREPGYLLAIGILGLVVSAVLIVLALNAFRRSREDRRN
jgi:uncharacterized membrane protein